MAPETREEWAAQSAVWPVTWRHPELTAFRASTQAPDISDACFATMCRHMEAAFAQAKLSPAGRANGAVIVDPMTGEASFAQRLCCKTLTGSCRQVLSRRAASTARMPTLCSTQLWSLLTQQLLRIARTTSHSRQVGCSLQPAAWILPQGSDQVTCCAEPAKRPRLDAAASSLFTDAPPPGTSAQHSRHEAGMSAAQVLQYPAVFCASTQAELSGMRRQYLCTGWDCYVVREPCAMCAMALTHSRVRWVVYCQADPVAGAVGGSFRLQSKRSLNHHFKVLHMPEAGAQTAPSQGAHETG